jgi:hypothetical protein
MKCSRCSAEIPAQSRFCLRCGTAVPSTTTTQMPTGYNPTMAAPQRASGNKGLYAVIGLLAIAVLALGGFVAKGMFQKSADDKKGQLVQAPGMGSSGALVQAPGDSKMAPIVQAPGDSTPAPIVQQPDSAPNPADIDDYLQFVRRIEASKQQLLRKQLKDALVMMTKAKMLSATIEEENYNNAFNDIGKGLSYNADEWEMLTREFQTRTPPPSCVDLRNKYLDQLAKIQTMVIEVNDALSKVQTDPSKALETLTQMQGKASIDADESIAKADDALAEVCSKYRLRKEFDIRSDSSSASMFR